jgi:hypothetical protein
MGEGKHAAPATRCQCAGQRVPATAPPPAMPLSLSPPPQIHWMRAARTDKGVSAVGQVVSLKMVLEPAGVVERINAALPDQVGPQGRWRVGAAAATYPKHTCAAWAAPRSTTAHSPGLRWSQPPPLAPHQIRVFGYERATNGFDSRKHCDKRRCGRQRAAQPSARAHAAEESAAPCRQAGFAVPGAAVPAVCPPAGTSMSCRSGPSTRGRAADVRTAQRQPWLMRRQASRSSSRCSSRSRTGSRSRSRTGSSSRCSQRWTQERRLRRPSLQRPRRRRRAARLQGRLRWR